MTPARTSVLVAIALAVLTPACGGADANGAGGGNSTATLAGPGSSTTSTASGHVGCTSDTDCDDGIGCTIDTCNAGACAHTIGPATGATACPAGEYCTLDQGCVAAPACASTKDCEDIWKDDACKTNVRCDGASSVCLFDVLDKDGDGHPPQVCGGDDCDDEDPARYPGAPELCDGKDNDCNGEVDDGATCDEHHVCTAGSCECKPEDLCHGSCGLDYSSDPSNCGSCGHACLDGEVCAESNCVCHDTMCPGLCTDTTVDQANCGGCGIDCGTGARCDQSTCACFDGFSPCTHGCADLQGDPMNCGGCGTTCDAATEDCDAGECTCRTGLTRCNGACVDTNTNLANCGGCGNICHGPAWCDAGECTCPGTKTACNGVCTDTATDAANCGGCGNACMAPNCVFRSHSSARSDGTRAAVPTRPERPLGRTRARIPTTRAPFRRTRARIPTTRAPVPTAPERGRGNRWPV